MPTVPAAVAAAAVAVAAATAELAATSQARLHMNNTYVCMYIYRQV